MTKRNTNKPSLKDYVKTEVTTAVKDTDGIAQ